MSVDGGESVTRYDPSSMARVDVGIEELGDDITMTDFSEYHISEIRKRARGKRIFISFISIFAIAGITLGIITGVSKSGTKTSRLSSKLSSKCSPNAVSTLNGFEDCKSVCAQAECCGLAKDDPGSCADERADTCEAFDTYCTVLSFDYDNNGKVEAREIVTVPPADLRINEVCEWDSLASGEGFFACENACKPGSCCYEVIETCLITNPEICDDYAACGILHVQQFVSVPPAVSNIAEICAPESLDDKDGYNMCKNACDPGECCLEPIEACRVENSDICSEYEVCKILHGTPKSHPSSIESQIVTKCNTNALVGDDSQAQECKDLCQPAACCFTSNKDDSCNTPDNEAWCSQYAACQLLDHIGDDGINNNKEAQDVVQSACSDTSSKGLIACSNVCAPANCCFDGSLDCTETGMDNLRCSHYEACGILYDHDKNPNTTTKPNPVATESDQKSSLELAMHISNVCSNESIQTTEGSDDCLNLCEDNLCCFADDEEVNCLKDHGEKCVVYAACDNIVHGEYALKPEDTSSQTSNNIPVENPKSYNEELTEKCQQAKITTLEGFNECLDLCKAHLCCSTTDKRENCYNDHPNECDDYAPCAVLTAHSSSLSNAEDIVDGVCDVESIKTREGLNECQSVCGEHLCCFSPIGTKSNCVDTLGEECSKYHSCIHLTLATGGPVGIRKDEPNSISSLNESESEGFDYKIPEQDSLGFSCSEEHIAEAGETDCDNMCNERSCCFEEGVGNCKVTDKDFCVSAETFCSEDSS
mmetsp:Transcript_3999/g.5278  ORF Transcript_3999/g.5278 Transcript_3999/m.5278 type:complete len:764 (-) Transcript_3999:437-2728(-)